MRLIAGAWGGAMLAGLLCIAYNTSANVSALEGSRQHLTFRSVAIITGAGGIVGLVITMVALSIAIATQAARQKR